MKIAIKIESSYPSNPIAMALRLILKDNEIVEPEAADLVIAQNPADLLALLKAGKLVIQFITNKHIAAAEGLRTAPDFADRFRIYQVVEWLPGIPTAEQMLKDLASGEVFKGVSLGKETR